MPTEISHQNVKQRIVDIFKNDTNVYPQVAEKDGKAREVYVGFPNGKETEDSMEPYIFVTSANLYETIIPESVSQNDAFVALEHTVRYLIVFVAQGNDARDTESQLDSMQKRIMESIENNYQLKDPVADNDPLAAKSFPERVEILNPGKLLGTERQGRIITLRCVIHTS